MASNPLTHHDILALVEPFTRRGHHVDLAASDRLQRRLLFKPTLHAVDASGAPALQETLQLDCYNAASFSLTRTLARPAGLKATLQISGAQPAGLLAHIDAIAPQRQFVDGAGFVIARSYSLEAAAGASSEGAAAPPLSLTRAVVQLDELTLTLAVSSVRGMSADISLSAAPGGSPGGLTADAPRGALDLPEDLLAVLGWNWTRLIRKKDDWDSKLRLRGKPAQRTRRAEMALDRAAAHLVLTLSEPPARFHERHLRARWWAAFRRAIPLLTPVALVIAILTLPRIEFGTTPGLWVMLYHVPTALIALSFCLQELPQYEIPPLPRRSRALAWRHPPQVVQPAAASVPI